MKLSLMHSTFLANLFLYATIYTTNNFIKEIYRSKLEVKNSRTSLLDMFTVLKLFTSWRISALVGRYQVHILVVIISLVSYCSLLCGILIWPEIIKGYKYSVLDIPITLFLFDFLIRMTESGMFPTMEVLILHVSNTESQNPKTFGMMRLSNAFGRFLAYAFSTFLTNTFSISQNASFVFGLIILGLTTAALLVYTLSLKIKIQSKVKETSPLGFFESFWKIASSSFGIVLFFIALQGITRTALSSYQTAQADKSKSGSAKKFYLFRCVPEILAGFTTSYFEQLVGVRWMAVIGGVLAISKGVGYAYFPMGNDTKFKNEWINTIYKFGLEIPKAIASAYIGYSCTRLNAYFNVPELRTYAQGLYNGAYSGLGAFLSGIFGFFYIRDPVSGDDQSVIDAEFSAFFKVVSFLSFIGVIPMIFLALRTK